MEKIASHQRSYHSGDRCIKLEHYLNTLLRKPGALTHSVAWHTAHDGIRKLYEKHFRGENKAFVMLLSYAKENGFSQDEIARAALSLQTRGVRQISSEQIKVMLQPEVDKTENTENVNPDSQEQDIEKAASGTLDGLTVLMGNMEINFLQINKQMNQ